MQPQAVVYQKWVAQDLYKHCLNTCKIFRSVEMMRKNSGFTAFELATTIAITAIVAAFVMPPYLSWLRDHRLRGATTNVVADIEMAKIKAIRENAFVVILFESDSYTVFVDNGSGGGTAGDWIRNGSEELMRLRTLPGAVRFDLDNLTLAANRVRFNGRGISPDIAGAETIPLVNPRGSKVVSLNRLGHLEMS